MTEAPANRSDCEAPRDSRRPIAFMQLNVSVSHSATYLDLDGEGNVLGGRHVTMSGSGSRAWARVPFPLVDPLTTSPGLGQFFLAQVGCCCKCRAIYVVDDLTLSNFPATSGAVSLDFDVTVTSQDLDAAGNATGDPVTVVFPEGVGIELWPIRSPPCQVAGGPSPAQPTARLTVPSRPLLPEVDAYPPDNDSLTVGGSGGPVSEDTEETGIFRVTFTNPDPCSDGWSLSAAIAMTASGPTVTASGSVDISLSVGS